MEVAGAALIILGPDVVPVTHAFFYLLGFLGILICVTLYRAYQPALNDS